MREDDEIQSDTFQDREMAYESYVVENARAIVQGGSDATPSIEHLRVLLSWLDGAITRRSGTSDKAQF